MKSKYQRTEGWGSVKQSIKKQKAEIYVKLKESRNRMLEFLGNTFVSVESWKTINKSSDDRIFKILKQYIGRRVTKILRIN